LSFPVLEDDKKQKVLGDIFLTTEKIIKEAKEDINLVFQKMILHGLLHLIGFDHMIEKDYQKMISVEEKVWKELIKN
jgi:probable rRNA maturation factor